MKKRFFTALLAAALPLLAGCGGEEAAPPASLPQTVPLDPFSFPAEVTEGRTPTEKYELPTALTELAFWDETAAPAALLAEVPDQNAAFYALWTPESEAPEAGELTALLRWGDSLAEFDWDYRTPRAIPPRLWCFDADGDGEEELVADCYMGSGTGVSVSQLHIVEKAADGTLTDYALPWQSFGDLTDLLRVETVEDRTYAVLGMELVNITAQLPEGADPAALTGLVTGSTVSFDVTPESDQGERIHFRGGAWLEGADIPPTVCYAVNVDASVEFADGTFTLTDLHLNSIN